MLETDAGSDRIGEFGIGMNNDIDRVTNQGSLDEKLGGTVHLALGRAYERTVAGGASGIEAPPTSTSSRT